MEKVYKDESLNRFNTEFHKSSSPPCSSFSGVGNNGAKVDDLTKELEHFVIKKCTSLTGNCTAVSDANNYFCILPNATMPENARGSP